MYKAAKQRLLLIGKIWAKKFDCLLSDWFGLQTSMACIDACYLFFSTGKKDDGIDHTKVNKFTKTTV